MAPRDEAMLVHMLHTALRARRPVGAALPARRGGRRAAAGASRGDRRSAPARSCARRPTAGERAGRVALLGYGTGVGKALGAAALLELDGIDGDGRRRALRQADRQRPVAQLAAEHELLVTVEEGVLGGGFGSAVWETLNEAGGAPTRILRVGVPDRYVTHGAPALLHEEIGFTAERIAERVRARSTARARRFAER